MICSNNRIHGSRGYTLVEVLVGILIFAIGMMALVQLQGNLAQSSADANARTVAVNVAEEIIESARRFSQVPSGGGIHAFNDIVDSSGTVPRAGYTYTATMEVSDYYYDPVTGSFYESETFPTGRINADVKLVELTVSWDDNPREFAIGDGTTTEGGLGSGSVTITDMISSMTSPADGKVVLGTGGGESTYSPPVDYSPGQNPDIVSINLGDNKFKESTTPLPDVIRTDELVETAFDVVTYSNPNDSSGATFLRREEFRAISCECTLRMPGEGAQKSKRPTIWNGYDYTEGELVSKAWGQSADSQQSSLCDLCCRDHHDGGFGQEDVAGDPGRSLYNPFRSTADYHTSGSLNGDHKHYGRDANGNLELADQDGEAYVEACRMVRKDGFFRVAQDLRQEGLNSFPANYLDDSSEIDVYSSYVTAAVKGYETAIGPTAPYEFSGVDLALPGEMVPAVVFPASSYANATQMSDQNGVTEQQLRSRGIYLDYMSDELRVKINCLELYNDGEACEVPQVSSALEIIPFYDVQLTWLSRWNETPSNYPIDVSNQAIADNNLHSRGLATLVAGFGYSTISAAVHTGNLGLTGTDPIDTRYVSDEAKYNLYAKAVDPSAPPTLSTITINGSILSAIPGLKAADVEILASEAQCDRTSTGFECVVEEGAKSPSLKIYNYDKAGKEVFACSNELALEPPREHVSINGSGSWTNFSLDVAGPVTTDIVIKEGGC